MYTYPIHCPSSRTATKTRPAPIALAVGTRCVKGIRPAAAARADLDAMAITEMLVSAFHDNGSQLYRDI
ncbi:hypothetical protein [uncultured Thiodictyon sp.]|uniref:hypothetical protein n=1 Tax=uncultured Thiodictyon sp. TaxID=1846217 RepID=UPI0025F1ABBA|nr:hypothetical protein [uncultured Thiodictyon sp.]